MTKQEFESVENHFIENANPRKIEQMTAYMKGKFTYLGITAPERKVLLKEIFDGYEWTRNELLSFAEHCWSSKYRELQYAALDIMSKHLKKIELRDISFLESLVLRHSWWDTVDGLAVNQIGLTLKRDDQEKRKWVTKWANSDHLWLRRTAILHQLKYKEDVDIELLEMTIHKANGTREFFLNKAIGWMLRQYSRTNPKYVRTFCDEHELSPLSRKEALRLILK